MSNRQDAQDQALSQLHRIADEKGFMPEKRMAVRPLHPEGMKALGKQVICAGGLLDEEGRMKGFARVMYPAAISGKRRPFP